MSSGNMRRIARWLGVALTVTAAVYFVAYAAENWSGLPDISWNATSLAAGLGALGLYAVMLLVMPLAWRMLLRAAGARTSVAEALAISLLSQFAKYVPGNVAHHIGRVVLARSYGLDVPLVMVSMTIETGWVVFAGAMIGAVALIAGSPAAFDAMPQVPAAWQLAFVGVAAAMAPFAGLWLFNRWRLGPLGRFFGGRPIDIPPVRVMVICFAIYIFNYLLMGAILYLLASRLFGQASADFWLLTGIFAVAWIAGFLTPGAPGGLGVREAILVTALGPLYGEGMAVALTVVLRALTVVGDGLGFLAGFAARSSAGSGKPS